MDNLGASFASLAKANNGYFKSEKQAQFLLSQCLTNSEGFNEFVDTASFWSFSFDMHYLCDKHGVARIVKYTKAKGFTTEWERRSAGTIAVQDAKEVKRIKREIKAIEKNLAARAAAIAAGTYTCGDEVANSMNAYDLQSLSDWKARLQQFQQFC